MLILTLKRTQRMCSITNSGIFKASETPNIFLDGEVAR